MATGCEKPKTESTSDEQILNADATVSQVQSSGCKSSSWDDINVISINYVDSFLYVNHSNASLNCGYDTVNVTMSMENNIITLQEKETHVDANCLCPVDVSYRIGNVPKGSYQVFVLFHSDTIHNQCYQW
jgi:hypothetical protein